MPVRFIVNALYPIGWVLFGFSLAGVVFASAPAHRPLGALAMVLSLAIVAIGAPYTHRK
ncbi:hypothetical protein ABZ793_06280 [Micromonospora sp. NPDC047465]|uniref:hypothetical protein n=1 Tax=Micromonospora sp. NPDC047465 TaxID=3154813 RepID=UPI0033F9D1FA